MRVCSDASRFSLTDGQVAVLRDAAGARIECLNGLLWITQEDEGRDVLLGPGEEITLERDGKTLVEALKPSLVWLLEPVDGEKEIPPRHSALIPAVFTASR